MMLRPSISQYLRMIVQYIRRISGDDAYERYVQHYHQHHSADGKVMLDRRAFYLAEQQRKWNGIKRCC